MKPSFPTRRSSDLHEPEGQGPAPALEALHAGLHAEHALDAKDQPVPRAPDEERPVRAMPETAEQHRQEQIAIGLGGAAAIAAERDVEIVAQPTRQAHVPAPPELGDALADVRLVEVRSEEHTSELQSLMRISYAVFCLK